MVHIKLLRGDSCLYAQESPLTKPLEAMLVTENQPQEVNMPGKHPTLYKEQRADWLSISIRKDFKEIARAQAENKAAS